MKKEIIDSLTGIRGIAAIYVVIYHLFHHASDNNFINNGYLSVDLFFILSGFIITHAHRNDFFDVVTKKNYITFMLSRVMRIWPAYVFWLLFNIAIIALKGRPISFDQIVSNVLMIQNMGLSSSIIGTGWSLSVEFFAYFFFPFICIFTMSKNAYKSLYIFLLSVCVIMLVAFVRHSFIVGSQIKFSDPLDVMSFDGFGALLRGLSEFCMGVVGYKIYIYAKNTSLKYVNHLTYAITFILIASLLSSGMDVLFSASTFVLIPLLAMGNNKIVSFLSSQFSVFLGKISFSLYLCHIPLVFYIYSRAELLLSNIIGHELFLLVACGAISISACIFIAWVSYELIEKKLRIYINIKMFNSKRIAKI
ncbi:TPA: acyltransferase [Klebsiella pneumoniae]|nr:acyltransferase [Klebsiella pneumoniae]